MAGRGRAFKNKSELEKELARTQAMLEELQKKHAQAPFDDDDEDGDDLETPKGGEWVLTIIKLFPFYLCVPYYIFRRKHIFVENAKLANSTFQKKTYQGISKLCILN